MRDACQSGTGVPSAIIRFFCHLVFGLFAFPAQGFLDDVKHCPELRAPPFSSDIYTGWRTAYIAGIFGFAWNFAMWIPTFVAPAPIIFIFGIVDMGIAAGITASLVILRNFIPTSKGSCKEANSYQAFHGNYSYFNISATEAKSSAANYCGDTVNTYNAGIALTVLYFLSAMCNIGLSSAVIFSASHLGNSQRYNSPRHYDRSCWKKFLIGITKCCCVFPMGMLYLLIPGFIKSRMWYAIRKTSKFMSGRRKAVDERLSSWRQKPNKATLDASSSILEINLEKNVLDSITPDQHYVDIVNLSLKSKSTHNTTATFDEKEQLMEDLRVKTCENGSKTHCWSCNMQICGTCEQELSIQDTETAVHLAFCKPQCSDCFFSGPCSRKDREMKCSCLEPTAGNNSGYYSYSTYGHYSYNQQPEIHRSELAEKRTAKSRNVCRNCYALGVDKILAMRDKREQAELLHLSRQPLACSKCQSSIQRPGPMWWNCKSCSRECRSKIHPQWARDPIDENI